MSRVEKTIQASFKGVEFFVTLEAEEAGRKVAIHDYPGSDVRFIEDLGKLPSAFRISAYVSGDDWVQKSRKLSTVLDEVTEGILEMSVFGIRKVKAQTYTKTTSQNTIGRVDFAITFLVSTPNPSPVIATATVENVAANAVEVLAVMQATVANELIVPELAEEQQVSTYDGVQLTESVGDKIASLGQDIDSVSSFVNDIRTNINDLVRDPITYASKVFNDGLLGEIFDTVEVSRDALNAFAELVRVGYALAVDFESIEDDLLSNAAQSFDIPIFSSDTRYGRTNNSNRLVITNGMRISILATYMNQAARNDYATDGEITAVIADIQDAYENTVLIEGIDPIVALALDLCRIETLKVLDDKIQTTPKVIDMDLAVPTVDVELAYRLYAEELEDSTDLSDQAEVLTNLNGILPTRYANTVKVLKV